MKENFAFVIFCTVATLISIPRFTEANRVRQTYGEYCNKTMKCDSKQWLRCNLENKCACKNEEMVWEHSKKSCVVLAGEKCKYNDNSSEEGGISVKLDCVKNSNCSSTGICSCHKNFYESEEGECVPSKLYGAHCKKPHECSGELQCVKNVCICNSTSSHYNGEECVGLAGEKCINGKCITSAYCDSSPYSTEANGYLFSWMGSTSLGTYYDDGDGQYPYEYGKIVSIKREVKDGICKCGESYQQSTSKYCVSAYGQRCEFCDEDLNQSCQRGIYEVMPTCKCIDSDHQQYDSKKKKCLNLVNGMCIFDEDCVANSICKHPHSTEPRPEDSKTLEHLEETQGDSKYGRIKGTCQCKKGFVEGPTGNCDLSYGSYCKNQDLEYLDSDYLTFDPTILSCDRAGELVCENSICSCGDRNKEFNEEKRRCVGLVGSRCFSDFDDCTNNATCSVKNSQANIRGTCECTDGFKRNSERKCDPNHTMTIHELYNDA